MDELFLVAGLGNPGSEYARTRHNAGFMVVDELAGRAGESLGDEKRFLSRVARVDIGGFRVLLCEPQTFMNASGEAVGRISNWFRVDIARVLVVVDDANLPLGEIRMRPAGSSGGHHGLESVEKHLGGPEYPRLRVGIGRRDGARQIRGYVLGRFEADEWKRMQSVIGRAADQVERWVTQGVARAMNEFNGVVEATKTPDN